MTFRSRPVLFSPSTVEGELPKTRVLSVVDDDASVRTAIGRLIKSFGFTVETFGSGEGFCFSAVCGLRPASCLTRRCQA